MDAQDDHDPSVAMAFAQLKPDQSIDDAREILLKTVEGMASDPPTQEEVDRAKARILKNIELAATNSQNGGAATGRVCGRWRLAHVLPAARRGGQGDARGCDARGEDVSEVVEPHAGRVYSDRGSGSRRDSGDTRSGGAFKDYNGGEAIQQGEVFDPTPQNIEARVIRATLPNGLKLVMFPKKTRGGTVTASLNVRFGDEKSLFGKSTAGTMAGALLMRGTTTKNRQQIQDETDRLKAQISVTGGSASAHRRASALWRRICADSLRFAGNCCASHRSPRRIRAASAAADRQRRERQKRAQYAGLHRTWTGIWTRNTRAAMCATPARIDERIEDLKKVSIDDVRQFYKQFYGAGEGRDRDQRAVRSRRDAKLVTELFGDWKSAQPLCAPSLDYEAVPQFNDKIETPDKQNALFLFGMPMKMNDEDPDYPALTIASVVFGGSPNSRLFQRIRVKDGLSYGASRRILHSRQGRWRRPRR